MKQGKTFEEVTTIVQRNAQSRLDFVTPLKQCALQTDEQGHSLWRVEEMGDFAVTPIFHDDLAEFFGIPKFYYDSMRELAPALLDQNINTWIGNLDSWLEPKDQSRLMRTFVSHDVPQTLSDTSQNTAHLDSPLQHSQGTARGMLSPAYLPLDDAEMFDALSPVLHRKGVQIESCEVSDRQTHLKLVTPRLKANVKVGDTVQAGVIISNSELGFGAIRVQQFVKRLVCLNGMVVPATEFQMRRTHLGKRPLPGKPLYRLYENEDRKDVQAAIWSKVSEAVNMVLEGAHFQQLVERFQAADKLPAKSDTEQIIARLTHRFGLLESEREAIGKHYENDKEFSLWGIANAVTRTANDLDSYERATELETIGGQLIHAPEREWHSLLNAN
ncbi:MAG: DUF932 domain-containing protein [Abitibacteriaceae bacterium]|nr:DUF932 domain-containing protein [Abditibacteriaceae bacterium]MBV9868754.1 DUF932 domain-containing protein [Abditibacteriaceae bacterium]